MVGRLFVDKACEFLTAEYPDKIERAVRAMDEAAVWRRANGASNSVGNLLLHLRGNVTQWIIGGVGQRPYDRQRDQEFAAQGPIPSADLLRQLRQVVDEAGAIIRALDEADLASRRDIQGYEVSVLEAVFHVVEHFSMHTGQIIWAAKAHSGRDLQLWQPPA